MQLLSFHALTVILLQVSVTSATAALEVMRRGAKQRQRAATAMNFQSSRSHSIFTVSLDFSHDGLHLGVGDLFKHTLHSALLPCVPRA